MNVLKKLMRLVNMTLAEIMCTVCMGDDLADSFSFAMDCGLRQGGAFAFLILT